MKIAKNKTAVIAIAIFLTLSMGASIMLIPSASAHTPAWNIPTYAYIFAAPSTVGVGQTTLIYMWLDPVFGGAGGATAAVGTNGSTASAGLLSNNYRFHNYKLTITDPNGTVTTQTWDVIWDTTSNQYYKFTPTQVGTYTLKFDFPGQAYAQYAHYENSVLVNDTYLASTASTTLTVQQEQIAEAINSYPLPQAYWSHPIYGENTDWWAISSNWLGSGAPIPADYTSSTLYHGDAIGPLTSHVMWTRPLQYGGVVGGNQYPTAQGVQYFEGSSYWPRFSNPIIINGYIYYTEPVSFTGPSSGPTDCVDLRTGKVLWSRSDVPPLSFGYIYNLWDPEQHGTFAPYLFAAIGGGLTGLPSMWEVFDGYTGDNVFNITGVPGFAPQTGQLEAGKPAVALTYAAAAGPNGEQLRYVFANAGTSANPQWYLSQWNSSKLWSYDVNPYTGGGSYGPAIQNASGIMVPNLPIPLLGETGTLPNGGSIFVPYGSTLLVNGSREDITSLSNPLGRYDWNVSIPWLNTMPLQPTYNLVTGGTVPAIEQGTATDFLASGGTNPVSVVAVNYGDVMLCRNGTLPTGFKASSTGYPQLPYTMFAVNLNASRSAIGQILWMQNYNPPANNITVAQGPVDFQTRVFILNYEETMQWVGYSLTTGNKIWDPTAPQPALDYYGLGNLMLGTLAYGKLYSSQMSGICYCYDDLTGKLLWTYGNGGEGNSTYAGFNTGYGDYPTCVQSIANGVVYLATDEHTILNPIYKGAEITAINATTGQEIWTLSNYPSEWATPGSSFVVADGYLTTMNGYDNNIYSIGRGPSATTVQAPLTQITAGNNVVIQGTVMDISAGTQQTQQVADFPNGVTCVSDASMKDWMSYVYQQKPFPTNVTGVEVTLDAVDPNGNWIHIGTVTSDTSGLFHYAWKTPDVPGEYTVIATFAGTNGYWPSYAETAMYVQEAPPATPTPTPAAPLPPYEMYTIGTGVAIIIAVAIVGILLLRKRP